MKKPDYEVKDMGYDTPCWIWLKYIETKGRSHGYPKKWRNGKNHRAHRLYYEEHFGVVLLPEETLDHLCRNRACVNPEHMEICTALENHHRRSRITQEIADEIRKVYPEIGSQRKVAAQFGLSRRYVIDILRGNVW